jgi:hypothetical protein
VRRLVLATIVLGSCAYPKGVDPVDPGTSDLAVYRAVLDSMFVHEASSGTRQLVVLDSTVPRKRENWGGFLIREFVRLPGVDTATVQNLLDRSRQPHSLAALPHLDLAIPVTLADRKTLVALPRNSAALYWSEFYKAYPESGGLIELSGVGYNAARNLAVLTVDTGCGELCGSGLLVVVRRLAGVWKIATIKVTVVS